GFSSCAAILVATRLTCFFYTTRSTPVIYSLTLHDALPICALGSPPQIAVSQCLRHRIQQKYCVHQTHRFYSPPNTPAYHAIGVIDVRWLHHQRLTPVGHPP